MSVVAYDPLRDSRHKAARSARRDRWQKPKEGTHPRALAGHWRVNRHNGMTSATPPAFRDELLALAHSAFHASSLPTLSAVQERGD